jgi:glyoxylase-like metal-dependent hydrolase (beta-lactamase superfamily II)
MTTLADGVHFAHTPMVNWVVLVEGDTVTLIDGGYPGHLGAVEESVRRAGARPEQIDSVLVTHAHVDHIGTAPALVRKYAARVLTSEVEARHVRGEVHESATPLDVLRRSYNPRIARWGLQVVALGGTQHPRVESVQAVPFGTPLDLPRSPVAMSLGGHTSGHTAYVVPGPARSLSATPSRLLTPRRASRDLSC